MQNEYEQREVSHREIDEHNGRDDIFVSQHHKVLHERLAGVRRKSAIILEQHGR